MRRLMLGFVVALALASSLIAQSGLGPIGTLQGKVDSNNALVVSAATAIGSTGTQGSPIANLQGKVDANNALVVALTGAAAFTSWSTTAANTALVAGLGTTSTNAINITNTTAAAAGAQQYSPFLTLTGQGWKTDATAASQAVAFRVGVRPVEGASAPTGQLDFHSSINAGANTRIGSVSSAGGWDFSAASGAGTINITAAGVMNFTSRLAVFSPAANELSITNTGGSANGGLRAALIVEANTGAKSPSALENNELYTNTGDSDGSSIGLLNDPTVGTQYHVAVTAAQTITITAASGETLKFGGSTCGTSLTSNTVGSAVTIVAATGGSGGIWITTASTGTWTCNA